MSYSGTVKDNDGKEYNVSISLSEIVNTSPVVEEAAKVEEVEPGMGEAQQMPSEGVV